MMDLKIASKTLRNAQEVLQHYSYYLIIDTIETDHFACENYGVCIREENGESTEIHGITTSAYQIDELMTMLVEQGVTPCTLRDVVDDFLLK